MTRKRVQLGLIHVAVAMTLVPINSTLNRVMIKELGISATVVAILASLPYVFSPIQIAIGTISDRYPFFGFRRSPYILIGLLLCVAGVIISPRVAFLMGENTWLGVGVGVLAFGAWGMGYNFSSVSYLSLATELSGQDGRGKTIAIMWFMMIVSIIFTALGISRMVETYTPETLMRSFLVVGLVALVLGLVGLIGLEPRSAAGTSAGAEAYTLKQMAEAVLFNRQVWLFFVYLLLLLAAILGQDILLEPYGAEAFGLQVKETSRITSIWGTFVLMAIILAAGLEGRISKRSVAQAGNFSALAGFLVILLSGFSASQAVFYTGVIALGFGTGLSTVANLSLMFDLTTAENIGIFIGVWGFSNAMSRLVGSVLAGVVRDLVNTRWMGYPLYGYLVAFGIEAGMLFIAILLLRRIDVGAFKKQALEPAFMEKVAMAD
ncbi:MAG: BCD family MFS transporter [Anaerolineales bacterium]|nr:BCD family MFS transporter [Anaerolineales bacterium]